MLEYIDSIQVSSMVSSAKKKEKFFIGYKDDDYKVKPFYIMLPKTKTYVKKYDSETRWMIVFIKGHNLLKKKKKKK